MAGFSCFLVIFDGFWGRPLGPTVLGGLCSGLHGKSQKARPNDRILRGALFDPPDGQNGVRKGFRALFLTKFSKILCFFNKVADNLL